MPSNPQDTFVTTAASNAAASLFGNNAATFTIPPQTIGGGSCNTSTTAPLNTSGYVSYYYPWYPYTYPAPDQSERIAALEGEVKVLREIMAAMLGGGHVKPTHSGKRTRKV